MVSSTGSAWPRMLLCLGLVEYCAIVFLIEMASDGLYLWIVGIGEVPEVDVSIRVFIGLTKQPNGAPRSANLSQRNCKSSRGTQAETSST